MRKRKRRSRKKMMRRRRNRTRMSKVIYLNVSGTCVTLFIIISVLLSAISAPSPPLNTEFRPFSSLCPLHQLRWSLRITNEPQGQNENYAKAETSCAKSLIAKRQQHKQKKQNTSANLQTAVASRLQINLSRNSP